jgi:hypothetical protein
MSDSEINRGQCHCGAVTYSIAAGALPVHHALCHCTDCRRSSGAPAIGWALFAADHVTINGHVTVYESSEHGRRHFCPKCGTGLFYTNDAIFGGQIDVQSATLDNPDAFSLGGQIQTAERIGWMTKLEQLPAFERYPGMD